MARPREPFRRRRDGSFTVELDRDERAVLGDLAEQLRDALLADAGDPGLQRLFPPASPDDPEVDAEYQRLMGGELLASRLGALDVVVTTRELSSLDESQLQQWLQAVNAMRLVLGTRLDAGEEPVEIQHDDPLLPAWVLYDFLGRLVASGVHALTG